MNTNRLWRFRLASFCVASIALTFTTGGATAAVSGDSGAPVHSVRGPIVAIEGGAVHGEALAGSIAFRGLPYAASPTGQLRWRPPQHPARWKGVRDATAFAASCPQLPSGFAGPGPFSEDCLYVNVSTPTLHRSARLPVLVWLHGGGFTQDASRNYDGSKLAAHGVVVVTVGYRLGALGFLAHPALASRPGGPAGNYGLMDQQAALRWVQRNIARFGGDRHNVTIAGQSAGGVAVLAHLVSRGSRGLFDRAIVQSGAFALNQQPLAQAEAFGASFADSVGCPDQSAQCLRHVPVDQLLAKFPGAAIPGVVDGKVLTEPIGSALAAGRFARVPVLNGINHDEEWIFVAGLQVAVSGGTFVPAPTPTPATYQSVIQSVLGVSAARAAAVAAEYPVGAYPAPVVALSTLVADANFACPALQVDQWTSKHVPTFAYQFDDDSAPQRLTPPGVLPQIATHSSELQYLFDQPNTPVPATLNATQAELAETMQAAWARFAAVGDPATAAVPWPALAGGTPVLSFASPQPQLVTSFGATHHCSFWAA